MYPEFKKDPKQVKLWKLAENLILFTGLYHSGLLNAWFMDEKVREE